MKEAADEIVRERGPDFERLGADLEVLPIRISHLTEVGEGVQLGISPHDPADLGIVADFESDIEVRRRRRLTDEWAEVKSADDVRSWLRAEAEVYLTRLRSMRGGDGAG